jgi:hypothetical protein
MIPSTPHTLGTEREDANFKPPYLDIPLTFVLMPHFHLRGVERLQNFRQGLEKVFCGNIEAAREYTIPTHRKPCGAKDIYICLRCRTEHNRQEGLPHPCLQGKQQKQDSVDGVVPGANATAFISTECIIYILYLWIHTKMFTYMHMCHRTGDE